MKSIDVRFSIIVPVYNVESYLEECIKSVLQQTYTNYEIILVNDGSTDDSSLICQKLAEMYSNIRIFNRENGGLSAARNTGIQHAIGEYLIFLDSDDYWDDIWVLQELDDIINEQQPDVITWSFKKLIEESGEIKKNNIPILPLMCEDKCEALRVLLKHSWFKASAWDKAIRHSLVEKYALYFKEGDTSEDIEWTAEVLLHMNTICAYPKDFYVYRQRKGSITKTKSEKNIQDLVRHIEVCVQYGEDMQDDWGLKPIYWSYVAEQFANMMIVFAMEQVSSKYIEKGQQYKWLLNYACTKRAKICRWISKIVGIRGFVLLLRIFLKMRLR